MSDIMQSPEKRIPGTSYYVKIVSKKLIVSRYGKIVEEIPVEVNVNDVAKALEHFLRSHEFYHSKESIKSFAEELVGKYGMMPKPLPQIRKIEEKAEVAEPERIIERPPPTPPPAAEKVEAPEVAEEIKPPEEIKPEAPEAVTEEVIEEKVEEIPAPPPKIEEMKFVTIIGCEDSIRKFLGELQFEDESFFKAFGEEKTATLQFDVEEKPIKARLVECSATDQLSKALENSLSIMLVEYRKADIFADNILPIVLEHVGARDKPILIVDRTEEGFPIDKIREVIRKYPNVAYIRPDVNVSVAFNDLLIILSEKTKEGKEKIIKEINEVYLPKEEKKEKKGFLKRLFG
ncbi:MAG: hypothetical protein J7L07_04145 [Candidatus Odinarchaeota archaeon]|nr:hypothetical protein [Candidatus Odinarchaeota archaeon]